ncbi:hypothetical protein Bca52824_089132 [Brassica carinata]|uniref:Uncharacterized protein n=2 Tax=Brassica TaxID=3705 RepID=A0A8X7PH63_BRACI|nr:hypothetical protein Bca52824_089132 [Brassica carinata]
METTIEASTTRVDANKPPSSGTVVDVESDEKQATTPDPRWPYLNRWSSNPLHEASAPAALKLVPPHPLTGPMIVAPLGDSGAPPTSSAVPPYVTHDQESSMVAAAHDSSSISDIHNSSLVTAVHDSLATAVHDSLVAAVHESLVVESLGAWSKPLHFTPPPPHLGVSEAVQYQIDSFSPTIAEAILLPNSSASGVDHPEPNSRSPIAQQTHETFKKPLFTLPPKDAFASPVTHSHEVHSNPCSQINHTLPLLATEKAAPVQSHIMETIPSHSIILEDSETSKIKQSIDPRSPLTLDHHNFHTEDTPPVYGKDPSKEMKETKEKRQKSFRVEGRRHCEFRKRHSTHRDTHFRGREEKEGESYIERHNMTLFNIQRHNSNFFYGTEPVSLSSTYIITIPLSITTSIIIFISAIATSSTSFTTFVLIATFV